jgi:hypothetical protein
MGGTLDVLLHELIEFRKVSTEVTREIAEVLGMSRL